MKIYKDTYPDFDSQAAIEAEIQKAADQWQRHCDGENFPFEAQSWALELAKTSEEWEFVDKTQQEEQQEAAEEARIEAEVTAENEKLAAQTTPSPNYAWFRQMEYPDPMILNDARAKQHSEDPDMQAEGLAQEQQYYVDCLAVKAKYPKYVEE